LIEQRLEELEVALVDEGHVHRRALERLRGAESSKPSADDDHSVVVGHLSRLAAVVEQGVGQR
jgi:hypothetical protein